MTTTALHDPATLDELRRQLAPFIAEAAMFDGWTPAAVAAAAQATGIDPEAAAWAFGGKSGEMIAAWVAHIDAAMATAWPAEALTGLSIRQRIRQLIGCRLELLTGQEEALSRALIELARPVHAGLALRLSWASADLMWRLAGDTATDLNHYSKRMTLAAIHTATLAIFADDRSDDHAEAYAFLDRRIEGVMRFEKFKRQLIRPDADRFSVTRLLGRLRYPAR